MAGSNEDMLVLDTRNATRVQHMKLITNEHPEGIVFDIKPINSDTYLKVVDKAQKMQSLQKLHGMDGKETVKAAESLYSLIVPLVEPNEEFAKWVNDVKARNLSYAYNRVMEQITALVLPNIKVK